MSCGAENFQTISHRARCVPNEDGKKVGAAEDSITRAKSKTMGTNYMGTDFRHEMASASAKQSDRNRC